jgi:hypothetical protein
MAAAEDTEEQTLRQQMSEETLLVFHWISKAFQAKFEARAAQERAPDRDRAVPGQHITVLEVASNGEAAQRH